MIVAWFAINLDKIDGMKKDCRAIRAMGLAKNEYRYDVLYRVSYVQQMSMIHIISLTASFIILLFCENI